MGWIRRIKKEKTITKCEEPNRASMQRA